MYAFPKDTPRSGLTFPTTKVTSNGRGSRRNRPPMPHSSSYISRPQREGTTKTNVLQGTGKKPRSTDSYVAHTTISSSGDAQANMFIRNVKLEKGDLPPMVDIEESPKDKAAFALELKKFILRLEEHYGVKPLIYSYPKFHEKHLQDPFFKDYGLWIAHYYVDTPNISREWTMWQFTDLGKVPGIKNKVDINVIEGGEERLRELQIK